MSANARVIVILAAVAGLAVACSESTRPLPGAPVAGQPAVPAPPIVPFPAVTREASIYLGPSDLYTVGRPGGGLQLTRFVLYADGTFALQFADVLGVIELTGRFTRNESLVTFEWNSGTGGARWGATGTLSGDALEVKYNEVMHAIDFVDGTYVRVAAGS